MADDKPFELGIFDAGGDLIAVSTPPPPTQGFPLIIHGEAVAVPFSSGGTVNLETGEVTLSLPRPLSDPSLDVVRQEVKDLRTKVAALETLLVKLTGMDLERLERVLREKERRGL